MSKNTTRELEVREMFNYPDPRGDRRFMVIEYEVTKKEVNRYILIQKD
ncbi:hypothetical protein KA005_27730 [bacterium]|nr:hypothetical protein [bacterium]